MERLPIEMIAKISCYLSVADLVACSATCRTWREMFSDDMVWRRHCTLRLVEYLENTDTTIPGLQLTEHSSLSPLPEWRTRFIRENCLWNNWRQANFRRHVVASIDGIETLVIFYKNDYLVTVIFNQVQLWDVRDVPICLITDPCELDKTLDIDYVKVLNEDRILFVQSSKVSVFLISVTSSPWSLIHTFNFNERHSSESNGEKGMTPPPPDDQDDESVANKYIYVASGDYFLGVAAGYNRLLHIWNISTGEKLKEVICPIRNQNSYFTGIYYSHKPSTDFVFTMEEIREDVEEIVVFQDGEVTDRDDREDQLLPFSGRPGSL
ncbi:uncharacterized protein LOC124359656 isoform X3 [Homalodisca vitripennis]|uniref:uncharacterized protein LOC124359656 isoform X3 n=1 Tax=Homalodisca vitripennis TaxID=197043 RepID=UPI001EECB088|nr:uncharacterized protein LOC124359656 isoform X3 [Homalodisca vitripennis]